MNFTVYLSYSYELDGKDRPPTAKHLRRLRQQLSQELANRLAESFQQRPSQFSLDRARITVLAAEVSEPRPRA